MDAAEAPSPAPAPVTAPAKNGDRKTTVFTVRSYLVSPH